MQKLSKGKSKASVDQSPAYEMHELYKGKVKVKFYPKSHQYWVSVNGEKFKRRTGVTTIIGIKDKSRPLKVWQQRVTASFLFDLVKKNKEINLKSAVEAVMQCDVLKSEAADIGKEIHTWCEEYIRHKLKQEEFRALPKIPNFPEAVNGVNAFLSWEKEHKVKFIATEKIVYSMKNDYIGIEDVQFIVDGLYCDGDFKSSNGLYNGVRLQTAAYSFARMEEGGRKSQGRWAIRLSKYSEEEYFKKEEEKQRLKKIMCEIQGKEYKDYGIKPYQVFEAKFLDADKSYLKRDFEVFLSFKKGFDWNKKTNPFYVGKDW